MPRDHRKLNAFNLADALTLELYKSTIDFPDSERYGLRSQLRRAAVSVPTNIVEGCARESEGDFLRFVDIAFASAREVIYLIDLSRRLGFVAAAPASRVEELGRRTAAALAGLKKSIRSRT